MPSLLSSLYALIAVLAAAAGLALALIGWQRRAVPASLPFAGLALSAAWWAGTSALETLVWSQPVEIWISKIAYFGKESVPVCFLLFAIEYTRLSRWVPRSARNALWIFPLLSVFIVLTNELHHLFWSDISPATTVAGEIYIYEHGPWFWITAGYNYALLLSGVLVIARYAFSSIRLYRAQALALVAGLLFSLLGNVLYIFHLTPFPGLDLTPIFVVATALIYAVGVFRFRLLDIMPAARDLLVERMDEGLVVLDQAGRIIDLNPTASRLIGLPESMVGQEAQSGFPDWLRWAAARGKDEQRVVEVPRPGAKPLYVEIARTTLYTHAGTASGQVVILRDQTSRRQVEKLREDLIRTIIHDLRSPLSSITLALGMLDRPGRDAADGEALMIANRSVGRMLGLVNSILDLDRLEKGQMPLECSPLDVSVLVADVVVNQQGHAQASGVTLTGAVPAGLPWAFADSALVQRVLQNLLDNALTFTPRGESVQVTARLDSAENMIVVSVADTGPGVAAEIKPRLFQMFATGRHGGSGIGLAFCRLAVEAHGGRIWVEDGQPNGAIFSFTLPAVFGGVNDSIAF